MNFSVFVALSLFAYVYCMPSLVDNYHQSGHSIADSTHGYLSHQAPINGHNHGHHHGHSVGHAAIKVIGSSGIVTGQGASGPAGHVNGHGAVGPSGEHNALGHDHAAIKNVHTHELTHYTHHHISDHHVHHGSTQHVVLHNIPAAHHELHHRVLQHVSSPHHHVSVVSPIDHNIHVHSSDHH